ncbi:MAG: hypothetical protein AAGE94_08435 [Acidobacteriota bacterium]
MATLAPGGRIDRATVDEEIERLRRTWAVGEPVAPGADLGRDLLGVDGWDALDRFDRVQLADALRVCARSPTLAAAGRELFAVSRQRKKQPNDADRIRKYLGRFGVAWSDLETSARRGS